MTLKELRSLLAKWQPRLRLEDWAINIRFFTAAESKGEYKDHFGLCENEGTTKDAEVMIKHPRYLGDDTVMYEIRRDLEVTVVHELLHLHMVPFRTKTGTLQETAEENLVHALSILLVSLDRGDPTVMHKRLPKMAAITPHMKIGVQRASAKRKVKSTGKEASTEVKHEAFTIIAEDQACQTRPTSGQEGAGSAATDHIQPSAR